jgi:hypothetical protein
MSQETEYRIQETEVRIQEYKKQFGVSRKHVTHQPSGKLNNPKNTARDGHNDATTLGP